MKVNKISMVSKDIKFKLNTTPSSLYRDYLSAINGMLSLSNKEIDVLAAFVFHYNQIKLKTTNEEVINELLFSPKYKAMVKDTAQMGDLNFNNYIAALKKKGMIIVSDSSTEGEDDTFQTKELNKLVIPNINVQKDKYLKLEIYFNIEEDEQTQDGALLEERDQWSFEAGVQNQIVTAPTPEYRNNEEDGDEFTPLTDDTIASGYDTGEGFTDVSTFDNSGEGDEEV